MPRRDLQTAFLDRLGGKYRGILAGDCAAIIDQGEWAAFWGAWVEEVRPLRLREMLGIGKRELSEWRRGLRIAVPVRTLERVAFKLCETAEALDEAQPGLGRSWLRGQQRRLSEATDRQVVKRLREWRRVKRQAEPPSQVAAASLEELICWDPPARVLSATDLGVWRRVTARELARLRSRRACGQLLVLELLGEQKVPESWVVARPEPARLTQLHPSILGYQQSWSQDNPWRRSIRAVLSRALILGPDGMERARREAQQLGIGNGGDSRLDNLAIPDAVTSA